MASALAARSRQTLEDLVHRASRAGRGASLRRTFDKPGLGIRRDPEERITARKLLAAGEHWQHAPPKGRARQFHPNRRRSSLDRLRRDSSSGRSWKSNKKLRIDYCGLRGSGRIDRHYGNETIGDSKDRGQARMALR